MKRHLCKKTQIDLSVIFGVLCIITANVPTVAYSSPIFDVADLNRRLIAA